MRGVFSLYETPGGGYHITYRQDGSGEETQVEIPGVVVRMARAVGGNRISISTKLPAGKLAPCNRG